MCVYIEKEKGVSLERMGRLQHLEKETSNDGDVNQEDGPMWRNWAPKIFSASCHMREITKFILEDAILMSKTSKFKF